MPSITLAKQPSITFHINKAVDRACVGGPANRPNAELGLLGVFRQELLINASAFMSF